MRLVLIAMFAGLAMMGCGKSEQVESAAPATKIEVPAAKTIDLSRYVGKHPSELMGEPQISASLDKILGSNAKSFFDNLDVSSGLEDRGDYYFGAGCAPHNCSVYESAFAVNKKDLSVYAAVLEGGDKLSYFGASSAKNLPLPLGEWYRDSGGKEEIGGQTSLSKQAAPQPSATAPQQQLSTSKTIDWVNGRNFSDISFDEVLRHTDKDASKPIIYNDNGIDKNACMHGARFFYTMYMMKEKGDKTATDVLQKALSKEDFVNGPIKQMLFTGRLGANDYEWIKLGAVEDFYAARLGKNMENWLMDSIGIFKMCNAGIAKSNQ